MLTSGWCTLHPLTFEPGSCCLLHQQPDVSSENYLLNMYYRHKNTNIFGQDTCTSSRMYHRKTICWTLTSAHTKIQKCSMYIRHIRQVNLKKYFFLDKTLSWKPMYHLKSICSTLTSAETFMWRGHLLIWEKNAQMCVSCWPKYLHAHSTFAVQCSVHCKYIAMAKMKNQYIICILQILQVHNHKL